MGYVSGTQIKMISYNSVASLGKRKALFKISVYYLKLLPAFHLNNDTEFIFKTGKANPERPTEVQK